MTIRNILIKLFELFIAICLMILSADVFLIVLNNFCYFIECFSESIAGWKVTFSIKDIVDLIIGAIIIFYISLNGLLLIRNFKTGCEK